MDSSFRKRFPFQRRQAESAKQRRQHPDRIPVIVEAYDGADSANRTRVGELTQHKFLVPSHITMGKFMCVLRQRLKLNAAMALILCTNHETKPRSIPPVSSLLSQIYATHHDLDGFLYFQYSGESCFGK